MTTLIERARTGAEMLDERVPGWYEKIDAATLNISSGCRCILGQMYGNFGIGLSALHIGAPVIYGFTVSLSESEALNEAWREEIARRKLAALPVETKQEVLA